VKPTHTPALFSSGLIAVFSSLTALVGSAAMAQSGSNLPNTSQPGASGVVQMMRIDQADIELDGFLNESVWQNVEPLTVCG